ncbi:MAG: FecR domain-containing protein [Bacteroidota bacterium]
MQPNQSPDFTDETLLARWLSDELTDTERAQVETHPHFEDWKRLAEASAQLQAPNFDTDQQLDKLKAAKNQPETKLRKLNLQPFISIAAALIGLAIVAYLFWPSAGVTLRTSTAEQLIETLPDGSTVRLNAESELTYDITDRNQIRELYLDGEAFFEVTKGAEFTVKTKLGKIEVLGTAFNVFSRSDEFEVICQEGRVAVSDNGSKQFKISFGEAVRQLPNLGLTKQKGQLLSEMIWWEGYTQFKEASLSDVFDEFSRQFPIEVKLDAPQDGKYTGRLIHVDAHAALDLICSAMDLKYEFEGERSVRITTE